MNLVIDFDERLLATIAETQIKRLFQFNEFSSGEFALHVEKMTREATLQLLKELDIHSIIKDSVQSYAKGIIEDTVIKELKKMSHRVVKEMKDKGELI